MVVVVHAGFGIGWFNPEERREHDPTPCVFTSITPAWCGGRREGEEQRTLGEKDVGKLTPGEGKGCRGRGAEGAQGYKGTHGREDVHLGGRVSALVGVLIWVRWIVGPPVRWC